jgi:glutamate-ammonia-ligase adenylyltransferase
MQRLLEQVQFRNPERAAGELASLARALPQGTQARLERLLSSTADPDEALYYLERFLQEQPGWFFRLTESATTLQALVAVFSHSRFLSEAILKHPNWLDELFSSDDLQQLLSVETMEAMLETTLAAAPPDTPLPLSLAVFRRRQILRVLLRDVMGLAVLSEVTEELSNLADAILEAAYRRIRDQLVRRYGTPRCRDASPSAPECGFSIISLGKLGGRGLNYSSDIDLMFLYTANGYTDGPSSITNKEFFIKLANQCTELLSTYTAEGMCYRVDLRLRPDGRLGEVCISLDGAQDYYRNRARDWELQMLIKARVSAGDRDLGRQFLEFVEPLIYTSSLDFSAVESVSATRERISEKLAMRRGSAAALDIKLARGGIRDIEFLVQCLQRLHGGREPWVRHGGTLLALFRLRDKGLLSDSEYSKLASAYQFLRHLEHRLQYDEDQQTHTLPTHPAELEILARKMPFGEIEGVPSKENLLRQLNTHLERVQEIYERVIHAQRPIYYSPGPAETLAPTVEQSENRFPIIEPTSSNLVRFLDQKAPNLALKLNSGGLRRGQRHFEHFLERVLPNETWLNWLDSDPVLSSRSLDLFEHSSYFAEQLIRHPELIEELRRCERPAADKSYTDIISSISDVRNLRLFFLREMFRIQSASICLSVPIFTTLEDASELADTVIRVAYRMAVEQVRNAYLLENPAYEPTDQMSVITLGRLGMREFDLGSDADLVFALPDRDSPALQFWTRVAERMIDILTSYTGQGMMLAVDTRLRPNGREGALVQLESTYKEYFAMHAEAWEGITYMKARAVAGNIDRGTEFLHELQEVDWRRWGQSGRSKQALLQMRQRLEKELGGGNLLKAGGGGYYDIDFALMYLRLKSAGIFYKVLNTPARIDVVEKMGHLERADADFLRDAATFYRALDHALRVSSGHAEGELPKSPSQLENLFELVSRWTPAHLHDQPLDIELAQIQARTREFFVRLFAS